MEITARELYLFKECPLKYDFKINKRQSVEMSLNDGAKEALQATIRFYYFHLAQGKQMSYDDVKRKFSSLFYKDSSGFDITEAKDSTKRQKELKSIEMLHKFCLTQQHTPDLVEESQIEYRIPFGKEFFVKGTIPIVRVGQTGEEIVHYNLSANKPTPFWLKTDMDLTLQCIAFHSIYKRPIERIIVRHLYSGEEFETKRSKEDYQRVYKTIKMMKESIDKEWFFPRESVLCNSCTVQQLCMNWR